MIGAKFMQLSGYLSSTSSKWGVESAQGTAVRHDLESIAIALMDTLFD